MHFGIRVAILVIASYFLGNINFAKLISRRKSIDITKQGSGNPGTMNMVRTMGVKFGILTLLSDALKAAIPCLLGFFFLEYPNTSILAVYIAGLSVIIGHMFPVIYKFKGGKSVACAVGVFFVADWRFMLPIFVLAVATLFVLKYGSLASFVCVIGMTIVEYVQLFAFDSSEMFYKISVAVILSAMTFLIMFAHRGNIKRLLNGTGSRIDLIARAKERKAKKLAAQAGTDVISENEIKVEKTNAEIDNSNIKTFEEKEEVIE